MSNTSEVFRASEIFINILKAARDMIMPGINSFAFSQLDNCLRFILVRD